MGIRLARQSDVVVIGRLLEELGYPGTAAFLERRVEQLFRHPDEMLLVYEGEKGVVAVISVHFIPQLALAGDFARISYFAVGDGARGQGVGKDMEEYVEQLAREKGCDRIEVHCHERRKDAHRFYERQGYVEVPRYYVKRL